ncbi:MAG TPA: hypothetical protein VN033_10455 [Vulgatibacter sp.]|nr:hypothetical protein [Vulgatibacter sp.]
MEWITIRAYGLPYEAVFARDLLKGHGIRARVLDDGLVGVAPHLSNAVGGVRLQVDPAERKDALAILAAPHVVPDPVLRDDEPDEPSPAPPHPADKLARRAFVAAILGITVVPAIATMVSLDALFSFAKRAGETSSRARILAAVAAAIDLAFLAGLAATALARFA